MFGVALGAAALLISVPLFFWMTPVIIGLLLAVPLVTWTAARGRRTALRRAGLLATPEERAPPRVLQRAGEIAGELADALAVARGGASAARRPRSARRAPRHDAE